MEVYKDHLDKEKATIDPVFLQPVNAQSEYSLGPTYKVIDNSLAYPFDSSKDLLFLEKLNVDLNMWFESLNFFVTWPLFKSEFL